MKHPAALLTAVFLACATVTYAKDTHTYQNGFTGYVSKTSFPPDATLAKDRYISLTIKVDQKPTVSKSRFRTAFRAACFKHRYELRKAVRKISDHNDWRVKITFEWLVGSTNGVTVQNGKKLSLDLPYCNYIDE